MQIVAMMEVRFERRLAWAPGGGHIGRMFPSPSAPGIARLRQPERRVSQHHREWIWRLRGGLVAVEAAGAPGPAAS